MNNQGYFASEADYEAAKAQEMLFHDGRNDEKKYTCGVCGFEGTRSEYNKVEDTDAYLCPGCGTQNYAVDSSNGYSYFVDTVYRDVVEDLSKKLGISSQAAEQRLLTGGYRIECTIRPDIQELVDSVYQNLDNIPSTTSFQQLQSAIVLIDNATGDIIAMEGGVGEKDGSLTYNRAEAKLPTGSSIKPIAVYAPALDAGIITPATAFEDSPLYDDWPQNYYRSYSGMCLVQRGVRESLNTISVKALEKLGLQNSFDFMTQRLGFTTLVDSREIGGRSYSDIAYAPLALGELTYGLTVREMAQAYATFPNNGVFRQARTYTRVMDQAGNVILDNTQESHTAVSEKASKYTTSLLQDAVWNGTGSAAAMNNMSVAGKTGTSSNNQCYWFAGFTPYYTAVVWCGYDEPEQVVANGNPSIPLWNQVMRPLHEGLEYREFDLSGLQWYNICSDCGLLAGEACKKDVRSNGSNRVTSVRLFGEDCPQQYCTCHKLVKICKESGKIANEYCEHVPGNTVEETGMLVYNKDWKVNKDAPYVYNEEKAEVCTLHGPGSIQPPEEETLPPEPTEPETPADPFTPPPAADPSVALPPEATEWYERRKIGQY